MKQLTIQRESLSFLALTRNTVGLLEPIYLQETYIRAGSTLKEARDHSYQYSKLLWASETFMTWGTFGDLGKMYRSLVRDHGGCIGKLLREGDHTSIHIGWVFRRWQHNDEESFIKDTWVKVFRINPTIHIFENVHLT